jgi:hypothetical protein
MERMLSLLRAVDIHVLRSSLKGTEEVASKLGSGTGGEDEVESKQYKEKGSVSQGHFNSNEYPHIMCRRTGSMGDNHKKTVDISKPAEVLQSLVAGVSQSGADISVAAEAAVTLDLHHKSDGETTAACRAQTEDVESPHTVAIEGTAQTEAMSLQSRSYVMAGLALKRPTTGCCGGT